VKREGIHLGDAVIDVLINDAGCSSNTLVLLPSSQRDSLDFTPLAEALAAKCFRVLRPQPRGMGRSSAPPAHMTLHTLAEDVAHVIDQLGGGRAIVAGHAFGHYVARMTDIDHPERVQGVVMLAAAARVFPPGLTDSLDAAADPLCPASERLVHLQRAFFAPGNDASVWLTGWYPQWRSAYRQAGEFPPKDHWWPRAHAPILDLQGAQDPWRPRSSAAEVRDALGDSVSISVIEGASHALVPEQPAAVSAAISGWSQRLAARR
jgi:pimeloyl-ACP methyl ester carboxylesterase